MKCNNRWVLVLVVCRSVGKTKKNLGHSTKKKIEIIYKFKCIDLVYTHTHRDRDTPNPYHNHLLSSDLQYIQQIKKNEYNKEKNDALFLIFN